MSAGPRPGPIFFQERKTTVNNVIARRKARRNLIFAVGGGGIGLVAGYLELSLVQIVIVVLVSSAVVALWDWDAADNRAEQQANNDIALTELMEARARAERRRKRKQKDLEEQVR
jgi:hypothetical protein